MLPSCTDHYVPVFWALSSVYAKQPAYFRRSILNKPTPPYETPEKISRGAQAHSAPGPMVPSPKGSLAMKELVYARGISLTEKSRQAVSLSLYAWRDRLSNGR